MGQVEENFAVGYCRGLDIGWLPDGIGREFSARQLNARGGVKAATGQAPRLGLFAAWGSANGQFQIL